MATGRYTQFIEPLLRSARQFFCKNSAVTFFVFTDGYIDAAEDLVVTYQSRMGWPFDSMKRFHVYLDHFDLFENMDYLFAIDADMRFVGDIGEEILSDTVGTEHFLFRHARGPFESHPQSAATILSPFAKYYAGAFYGGKREQFLKMMQTLTAQVDKDLEKGIVAVWHDESHLNRYFFDHPPTLELPMNYCYPEAWGWDDTKKIVDVAKDRGETRLITLPQEEIHSYWWERALQGGSVNIETFVSWWGDIDAISRRAFRNAVRANHYLSVLDVGSGLSIDYEGLKQERIDIDYLGLDLTTTFLEWGKAKKIPILKVNVEKGLPFQDDQFDLCYARHLFDHLSHYEQCLKEMIRVGRKEVFIVFMRYSLYNGLNDYIELTSDHLYRNVYSRRKLEEFLTLQHKVIQFEWEEIDKRELILRIHLK